jgi:DNA-binding winged helix-turn-helix (wHTH) protein
MCGEGPPRFIEAKQSRNIASVRSQAMDVVLIRWPTEASRREELREAGVPRLLLVESGAAPPGAVDEIEDWIRVPADEVDLHARVENLGRRAREREHVAPELDEDGVLRVGAGWVPLPPVEARLTAALVERYGAVVSRDSLSRAGWPDGAPGRNALDVHVLRLRRRLAPLGLAIRTVRSRGYLLETSQPAWAATSAAPAAAAAGSR